MGRPQKQSKFVISKRVFERTVCQSRVRFRSVFAGVQATDPFAGLGIGNGIGLDDRTNCLRVVFEKPFDTWKVIRFGNIHRIGERGLSRIGCPNVVLEIPRDCIVRIGCGDESLDRQTHFAGDQSGGQVSKVARGDRDNQAVMTR